jgi:putative hemolysin
VIWLSIAVVLVLILVEALFAASELALVSLREGQIQALASKGRRGERIAALAADPNRDLSAVQTGVTTTSLLASAFCRTCSNAMASATASLAPWGSWWSRC